MKKILITYFFIFSALLLLFTACKKNAVTPSGHIEYGMLDSVNNLRLKGCNCGVDSMPPVGILIWNDQLAQAAEEHAKDMYNRHYFDHISPDGTSPIQRAAAAGFTGNTVGENIAMGYTNIKSVMAAWKASPDHCDAMMYPIYVKFGAYSYNGYWVQEFGN